MNPRPGAITLKGLTLALAISLPFAATFTAQAKLPTKPALDDSAIFSEMATAQPIFGKYGMVSSQEALATRIGVDILKKGGNAVDAAVAVGFALAVTLPRAGNLGGGGFMLVHLAKDNKTIAIDYRETAPKASRRDMFLDEAGNAVDELSRSHGLAVGVPGTVMGLELALEKYGTMSLSEVIAPAIQLAEDGVEVTAELASSLAGLHNWIAKWPTSAEIFYPNEGQNLTVGQRLVQKDLAESLRRVSKSGSKGFYEGETAEKLVAAVQEAGGIMTLEDLKAYKVMEREPVRGSYRGLEVVSMPPPSSGGIHIIQMLNVLEHFPMGELGHNSAQSIHFMAETMKRAYADRSEYLGDPDFVEVPVNALTSKAYGEAIAKTIAANKATPSDDIKPGKLTPYESDQTTHYSVVDKWGNAVSNTYTLNFSYGSGMVAKGTGVLLNNEMDDFAAKPGSPNGYGLLGGDANAVEPQKRPLSSMSPTIVMKDGKPFIVTGSPGGSRIINTVLQIIMNVVDHDLNIAEASIAPRIHHQWYPDEIRTERSLNLDTRRLLESMGHKVNVKHAMGSTQSIVVTEEGIYGASDPRQSASETLGY